MFGLKIFVRVQTFRPPVLPRNFCHPALSISSRFRRGHCQLMAVWPFADFSDVAVVIEHIVALLVIALTAMKLLCSISLVLPHFKVHVFRRYQRFHEYRRFHISSHKNYIMFWLWKAHPSHSPLFGLNWRGVVDLNSALAEAESEPIYLAIGYSTLSPL